jgi:structure-specific recognition protein 1
MTDRCLKGVNWGSITIDDNNLTLDYNKNSIFKLPLKSIGNSTLNKTDIKVEVRTDNNDDK